MRTLIVFLFFVPIFLGQEKTNVLLESVPVPRLGFGGYLADPDGLLKGQETELVDQLRKLEKISRVKISISIQLRLPQPLIEAADFRPNAAASLLVGYYCRKWRQGTYAKKRNLLFFKKKPSLVLFISVRSHGWAISGPPGIEKKLLGQENVKLLLQGVREFYDLRGKAPTDEKTVPIKALLRVLAIYEPALKTLH